MWRHWAGLLYWIRAADRTLFGRSSIRAGRGKRPNGRPRSTRFGGRRQRLWGFDRLEPRVMKSVNSLYDPASHTLTIVANDPSYNSIAVASNSAGQTTVNGFVMTSGSSALNAGDVQSLVINEGAGQDVLDVSGMTSRTCKTSASRWPAAATPCSGGRSRPISSALVAAAARGAATPAPVPATATGA